MRHDHEAVRAAAGGGFIVIFGNEFRDGLVELVAERRRSVGDRKRTWESTGRVASRLPASFARPTRSPTSRTTRAPKTIKELADSRSTSRFGSPAAGPKSLGETTKEAAVAAEVGVARSESSRLRVGSKATTAAAGSLMT